MIKKDLSIPELFGVLSVIALSISVLSNVYFYYCLDAMWVMSILSPTFYISEILKVLVLMSIAICFVGLLMDAFKWLIKTSYKVRLKECLKLPSQHDASDIHYQKIIKLEKSFQFWQMIFIVTVSTIFIFLLTLFKFISFASMLWSSILIGLVALTTCFSAHIKLNNLDQLPIAKLKNTKDITDWYVLDGSQDKLILLNLSPQKVIKVVKLDEIDRIFSNKK